MRTPLLGVVLASMSACDCGRTAPPAVRAPIVRVEAAEPINASRPLTAQIAFDERFVARLGIPVTGRVTAVRVGTGDKVTNGEALLTMHALELSDAHAQAERARTSRVLAEHALARAEWNTEDGAGTQSELQVAEAMLQHAKNEEHRTRAVLTLFGGDNGSEYTLRSPIDGTIVERSVTLGEWVHPRKQHLFVVADPTKVWVVAELFDHDIGRLHVGDVVDIRVKAYERTFEGRVAHLADTVRVQTRSIQAKIEIENTERLFKPGMFAYVDVRGAPKEVEVPTSALVKQRGENAVVVSQGGDYVVRKVEVGEERGAHTTIVAGLVAGELVVTDGAIFLSAENTAR